RPLGRAICPITYMSGPIFSNRTMVIFVRDLKPALYKQVARDTVDSVQISNGSIPRLSVAIPMTYQILD
ncbi:MAG: hypothetical protein WBQ31_11940, partial [Candidatus Acidiferrales bacterium]